MIGIGVSIPQIAVRRVGTASAPALVLDTLSAGAAYSTRKLRTAYSGAAIRVRRSSDNVEQDIGFSGNALDTTALTSFVGANSGFVVTWYDQSGNARHVTQATTTRQPRIVNAGVVETVASVPAPFFDGANHVLFNTSPFLYAAGAMTACIVCNNAQADGLTLFAERSSTVAAPAYQLRTGFTADLDALVFFARNDASTVLASNVKIADLAFNSTLKNIAIRDTGSTMQAYLNGTNGTDQAYTRAGSLTLDRFGLGGQVSSLGSFVMSAGHIAEAIFFPSALSNTDMNAVNASQGAAFGITVNPI